MNFMEIQDAERKPALLAIEAIVRIAQISTGEKKCKIYTSDGKEFNANESYEVLKASVLSFTDTEGKG